MKKKMSFLLIVIICFALLNTTTNAATGYQAYAVYNSGQKVVNVFGHGAMMVGAYSTSYKPVVHITTIAGPVKTDTWSNFIGTTTLYGAYSPKSGFNNMKRDLIVATARSMTSYSIKYCLLAQIDYPTSKIGNPVLGLGSITALRCDGVIEYCYEYNGVKIFGSSSGWNISVPSLASRNEHTGVSITPHSQRVNYMNLATTTP